MTPAAPSHGVPGGTPAYAPYLNEEALPLMWCPGCGGGTILKAFLSSLAALGIPREKVVVVTGIGCWGKADDYVSTNAVHGTHGRALPIATGIKAYRPELTVVALMGDGDCATIGGNHFIHAARRNIGVTAVVANNMNYGMTGGQYSGTTPQGSLTTTSPYGHTEEPFDLCELAEAAGASYVARTTSYHYRQMERLITGALTQTGFALVEVLSPCPTYFGRLNRQGDTRAMWRRLRETAEPTGLEPATPGKVTTGLLTRRDRPSFSEKYLEVQRRAATAGTKEAQADER